MFPRKSGIPISERKVERSKSFTMPKTPTESVGNSSEETRIDNPNKKPLKQRSSSFSTFDDKYFEKSQKQTTEVRNILESARKLFTESQSFSSSSETAKEASEKLELSKKLLAENFQLRSSLEDLEKEITQLRSVNSTLTKKNQILTESRKLPRKPETYFTSPFRDESLTAHIFRTARSSDGEESDVRPDSLMYSVSPKELKYTENVTPNNLTRDLYPEKLHCEEHIDGDLEAKKDQQRSLVLKLISELNQSESNSSKLKEENLQLRQRQDASGSSFISKFYRPDIFNSPLDSPLNARDLANNFTDGSDSSPLNRNVVLESTKAKEDEALKERDLARDENASLAALLKTKNDEIKLLKGEKDSAFQEIESLREEQSNIEEERSEGIRKQDRTIQKLKDLRERLQKAELAASETYVAIDQKEFAEKKLQDFFAEFSTKIANITIERDRANQELFHLRTESEKEIARLKEDLAKENQDLKLKLEKTAEKRGGIDAYITENQSLRQELTKLHVQFKGKFRETELLQLQLSAASDPKTIADLRSELDLLREELEKKDSENRILTATKDSNPSLAKVFVLEAENRTQKAQINRFEETTKQSEIASKNTALIIRDLETQIAGGPEKLANLQKQLESVTSALESQTLRVNEESSSRQEAEEEVAKLQNVKKINEDLQGTLEQVSIAKNNVETRSSEIEKENSELTRKLEEQQLNFLVALESKDGELRQQEVHSKTEHDSSIQRLQSEVDAARSAKEYAENSLRHFSNNLTQARFDIATREDIAIKAQRDAEAARDRALDDVARIRIEINDANSVRQQAENERDEEGGLRLEAKARELAANNALRDTENARLLAVYRENAKELERANIERERDDALADALNIENLRADEEVARIAAEGREAAEILLKNAAEANLLVMTADRDTRIFERDAVIIERDDRTRERDAEAALKLAAEGREAAEIALKNAAILNYGNMTLNRDARIVERDAARIDAADKERLRLDAERLKTTEENAKINALARLTASERSLLDLQKSSSYETSVARLQRDKDLKDIERLQRRLEKQSSAPEHKIIREFEKTFKPNYKKASDLLFGDKTEKEKNIEIDYYRNHRHKIYQDDDTKLAHTKIDLSEASDEEVIREIAKDRERAVRNSLPKLVAKLIGQKNKESVIENLSRTDIVIALSVGNSEEFDQWKKDNSDANIGATFFGKLEKGSKAQEIRSKAIENLLEGIKGYAAFFGVDDSKVLKPDMKPNTSPQFATIDALSEKFKSRS